MAATRGSFYHHFVDMGDYRRSLLAHYESEHTDRFIALAEELADATPHEQLATVANAVLAEHTAADAAIGRQLRGWAADDDDAAQTIARVDARRVEWLRETIAACGVPKSDASDQARAIYLLLIGAEHLSPPLPAKDLRRLWQPYLDALSEASR